MSNYRVYWKQYRGKQLVDKVDGTACFAGLNTVGNDKLVVYYWLESEVKQEDADWFITQFLMTNLSERVLDSFSISEVDKDNPPFPLQKGWWINLEVDLKKICAFDLYVLLCLARYPQENPKFCKAMRNLIETNKIDPGVAFVRAHTQSHNGYGHLMLPSSMQYGLAKCKSYNFKELWDKVDEGVDGRKSTCNISRSRTHKVTSFFDDPEVSAASKTMDWGW